MRAGEHSRIQPSEAVASRVVGGQAVLVSLEHQRMHELNEVGSRVWSLLDGRTLGEVADVIAREFEVDRERALEDVGAFIAELERLGALAPEKEAP